MTLSQSNDVGHYLNGIWQSLHEFEVALKAEKIENVDEATVEPQVRELRAKFHNILWHLSLYSKHGEAA